MSLTSRSLFSQVQRVVLQAPPPLARRCSGTSGELWGARAISRRRVTRLTRSGVRLGSLSRGAKSSLRDAAWIEQVRRTLDPSRAPRLREVLEPGSFFLIFCPSSSSLFTTRSLLGAHVVGERLGGSRVSLARLSPRASRLSHGAATSGRARAGRARAAGARRRVALGDGATATSKAAAAAESPHLGMRYASPAAGRSAPATNERPRARTLFLTLSLPLPLPFFSLSLLLPHSLSLFSPSHFLTPSPSLPAIRRVRPPGTLARPPWCLSNGVRRISLARRVLAAPGRCRRAEQASSPFLSSPSLLFTIGFPKFCAFCDVSLPLFSFLVFFSSSVAILCF